MFQKKTNISNSGLVSIVVGQAGTVVPEKTYRVTIEPKPGATGLVSLSCKYVLCEMYNALRDETGKNIPAVDLGVLTEPVHFYASGDIEEVAANGASISGEYSLIVCGW